MLSNFNSTERIFLDLGNNVFLEIFGKKALALTRMRLLQAKSNKKQVSFVKKNLFTFF